MSESKMEQHSLTTFAEVHGIEISYPPAEGPLFEKD